MAPIRRYLRITKHSVLEVRIYLDHPADAEAWLLKRNNPALPRVIQAVRPLVLPKLREENERVKGKGKGKAKKKGVKDVVVEDDFEMSIFLTELSSRHSLLTKQKAFKENPRLKSNSGKLTGWLTAGTSDEPIVVSEDTGNPIILREEDDDDAVILNTIPDKPPHNTVRSRRSQRKGRSDTVPSGESDTSNLPETRTGRDGNASDGESVDLGAPKQLDDKKLRMKTSYDGFSIYGRILCLVVKRTGSRSSTGGPGDAASGQQMLENWVSTQAAAEHGDDEDDIG